MKNTTLLFFAIAGLCLGALAGHTELVTTGPVRAVDNIPPSPVVLLRAVDTPDDTGGSITISWDPSGSNHQLMSTFGDVVVPRRDLLGYRIYRRPAFSDSQEVLLATVAPKVGSYVDRTVERGISYSYTVHPFDQDNETSYPALPGSTEDLMRIATAIDNTYVPPPPVVVPVGGDGLPVVGWFTRQGDRIGFDDFFLFADHFGLGTGDTAFDPTFDLVPSGRIDFDDFFLFADNFGKPIANADAVRASLGL